MTDPAALYSQLTLHFNRREWGRALELAAKLLPLAPRHPSVYYIAGISNLELQRFSQAVECLRRATTLEPTRADYAVQFAKTLAIANRSREAGAVAIHASTLACEDPLVLDTLGVVHSQVGNYAASADAFRKVVELAPTHAPYRYNLATSLVAAGEIKAAEIEIEACLRLDPHFWRAHMTLAQLRRQTAEYNHVDRLKFLLSKIDPKAGEPLALTCLNLALAKEYEDLNNYPQALHHLVRGKSVAGAGRGNSMQRDEAIFSAISAFFSRPIDTTDGCSTNEPIFVIGMPRSGTTLVERIISSHPDVQSAGELLNFAVSLRHYFQCSDPSLISPELIENAHSIHWKDLGEMYLASTRPATGQKPHFIDKLPHNFLYAGFIAHALPRAKIICLRRNPMDTCLSNFRQLFARNSPFFEYSFDLLDTGRYYALFDRLMAHWQRVLPGRILEIQYEKLVDSQETLTRQIIDFCGLTWDDRCMQFEENVLPVATASAVQVRAPMYRTALDRWKKYGPGLFELKQLLLDEGIDVKD